MTRRPLLLTLAVLLAAAGCSGSGRDDGAGPTTDPGAATVTVEHRYGRTEVPVRPERIVALDVQWTDVLLALDTPPVGYLLDPGVPDGFPWRGDRLAEATGLSATTALPYEDVAALHPDLIVVTYLAEDSEAYDTLSDIAPTIATLGENQVDTWQDIAGVAGRVLGAEDEAAALVADVDGRAAALGEELPGLEGTTFALVNYVPGDAFYVVSDPADGANVLFGQLGMEISPTIVAAGDGVSGRVELSLEQSSLLDAEVLLLLTNGADPTDIAGWDSLPAVRSGAVTLLDYASATALNTPTPLSVPFALDLVRPSLEAASA